MALSARGFERIPNGAYLPQARGEGRRERGHERIGGLRIDVVEVDVELLEAGGEGVDQTFGDRCGERAAAGAASGRIMTVAMRASGT